MDYVPRRLTGKIEAALHRQAVVALLGPRQSGKTTLARRIAEGRDAVYLDLERTEDRRRLEDVAGFVRAHEDRLVVLDEIHRTPELFPELRGHIDEGRRKGKGTGRFLVLGSASASLLRQSESLAGRIAYVDLGPLDVLEVGSIAEAVTRLWVRGGLPPSFLAGSDEESLRFRRDLIRAYLERDFLQFRPRAPALLLERLWTMLAHSQGGALNLARLAGSLMLSTKTVNAYLDLLEGMLLLRRLQPRHANVKKRLVRTPNVYIRDSGLTHALLGLGDFHALAAHPVVGTSWEGFVIETLLATAPWMTLPSYYRTSNGAEVDLVLDLPGRRDPWAIEIKRGSAPKVSRGFANACADLGAERAFVVHGGRHRYPKGDGVEAISLPEMAALLRDW
ncbi:MAG: ATP-binding protein [Acidobacteria bacterium]|nr:ATP-binding protein [Acidobacteriota bacterium]MYG74564.1 ATP-binding protein [Acidobacteriota bacterium]